MAITPKYELGQLVWFVYRPYTSHYPYVISEYNICEVKITESGIYYSAHAYLKVPEHLVFDDAEAAGKEAERRGKLGLSNEDKQ